MIYVKSCTCKEGFFFVFSITHVSSKSKNNDGGNRCDDDNYNIGGGGSYSHQSDVLDAAVAGI